MSISYLLDTHVVLWMDKSPGGFSDGVRKQLAEAQTLYYSAASSWESAIKRASGKLQMNAPFSAIAGGLQLVELVITSAHGEAAGALPNHHRDPFDRLIVSQAVANRLRLVTADSFLQAYDVDVLLV